MKKEGLSKAQLARELEVSNAHVANWLNGQMPRADQLLTIGRRFGVSIEWMLTGEGNPPPRTAPIDNGHLKAAAKSAEALGKKLREAQTELDRLRSFLG